MIGEGLIDMKRNHKISWIGFILSLVIMAALLLPGGTVSASASGGSGNCTSGNTAGTVSAGKIKINFFSLFTENGFDCAALREILEQLGCLENAQDGNGQAEATATPQATQTPEATNAPEETQAAETPQATATPQETETPKATATPEATAAPAPTQQTNASALEQQMVALVNAERAKVGASALTINTQLTKLARMKSQDMIDNNYFSHTSPTYGSPFDMMNSYGVTYRTAGENLAMNQTVENAHTALMNSSGHRANILNTSYTEIGIGIVSDGRGNIYVTQMFIGN